MKDKDGVYHDLTGNMSGCLLADYEDRTEKRIKRYCLKDGYLIKTIVTSNMADAIAEHIMSD